MKLKVTVDGRSYEVEVEILEGDPELGATRNPGLAAKPPPPERRRDSNEVCSPLVGTVIQVLVAPGDEVVEGTLLLLLEAMKMESEIVAPHAAKVKAVRVKAGDTVGQGSLLVVLEEVKAEG